MSAAAAQAAFRDEFLAQRFGSQARVEPLLGDASRRSYFRVRAGDCSWVLAMHPEPFEPETMPFLVMRELLAGFGLPVPRVEAVDGARAILLLEDLGDLMLQDVLPGASAAERLALYAQAQGQLIVLQRGAAKAPTRSAVCFQIAFDFEKLSWEMHYFWKHFLEAHRGCELSVDDRHALATSLHRLCDEIASWPRVLCHRDYHSRNLMLSRGTLHWIDFQDARLGPASYDLASLLRDPYVDLEEDFVAEQAEDFRERAGLSQGRESFRRQFDLMCVQRNLKALGTFGYMSAAEGKTTYLSAIPRALRSLRVTFPRHAELAALHQVLARHLEELR